MKKKNKQGLGRSLIKDRFGASSRHLKKSGDPCLIHTTELEDGYNWGRLNLQSVTEESSFQEFLSTAQLADHEFQAEKLNITFVNPASNVGLLSEEARKQVEEIYKKNEPLLGIPRRPKWNPGTSAADLQSSEREAFLDWRRRLALLQDMDNVVLTPYEKNLEFWRQLWRVVDRSDIVVQIVDARNPLLFRCDDLERYVKEVSNDKLNFILLNKADFLTSEQRNIWANYFSEKGIRVGFFSAIQSLEEEDVEKKSEESEDEYEEEIKNIDDVKDYQEESDTDDEHLVKKLNDLGFVTGNLEDEEDDIHQNSDMNLQKEKENEYNGEIENNEILQGKEEGGMSKVVKEITVLETETIEDEEGNENQKMPTKKSEHKVRFKDIRNEEEETSDLILNDRNVEEKVAGCVTNSSELLDREGLIALFKSIQVEKQYLSGVKTVGLVGYPNVGKSSTINALLMNKKVSVSATPGKTKHFQTLYIDEELMLCDCPGLVMPSFVFTKAEMVTSGILPIDQMRDHVAPVNLVTSLIPRHVFEDKYGIMIPLPREGEDPNRPPIAEELLNAYGYNRGFMTNRGLPDNPRSSRYILKDFVNGKLLYCYAPPDYPQEEFHTFPEKNKKSTDKTPANYDRVLRLHRKAGYDVDKTFFGGSTSGCHAKGVKKIYMHNGNANQPQGINPDKPWRVKPLRNKKEKLRRVYAHLDE